MNSIPLIKPYMTEAIKARVLDVLDSGYLTEGPVTRELESVMAAYTGSKHALAVTSCTTGMEIALRAMGIGPGDEVIVPDYTYPATAAVVCIVGATPVIVDVDADTLLINHQAAEAAITPKTRAIIPVSLFGNPLDYTWLQQLKEKHGLLILEDAACSLGTEWNGRRVGSLADISVFSLHPRKFITTGEGGIVTTDNDAWAEWMESYKHFGIDNTDASREGIHFGRIGTNYKLSNVQAAIGLGQMQDVDMLLAERRRLADTYLQLLQGHEKIGLPVTTAHGKHAWQTFSVSIPRRDEVMRNMRTQGIEVQIGTYSMHMHTAFQGPECRLRGPFGGSVKAFERTLALPLFRGMTPEEQKTVVTVLAGAVQNV